MLQIGNKDSQIVIDAREYDVKPILEYIIKSNKLVIGHNIKFDYKVIKINYGLELYNVADTMLQAQVIECGLDSPPGWFTLASVVQRYYDKYAYTNQGNLFLPYVTKKVRSTFSTVDGDFSEEQIVYGAMDVEKCFCTYLKLLEVIKEKDLWKTAELENKFCLVLADMELEGLPLDKEKWIQNAEKAEADLIPLGEELKKQADINWDSPKQVGNILKELGVDIQIMDKKTGTIKESVGKLVLAKYRKTYPLLDTYLTFKEDGKKAKAYGEKFLRHLNPTTGRIHSSFMQILNTGRTSSSNPNVQNIPRDLSYRECFKADEGRTFVIADFSNQELRVLADKAGEINMLKAFWNNEDIHWATAKVAFDNPDIPKESEERQMAKSMNFLMSFGGGPHKLKDAFGVSMAKAKSLAKMYFDRFPALHQYFIRVGEETKSTGIVKIDDTIGRISSLPWFDKYDFAKKHVEYFEARGWEAHPAIKDVYRMLDAQTQRQAQNRPIQGTAASISKEAGVRLRDNMLKTRKFKILLLIHDEWVLDCNTIDAREVAETLSRCCVEASKVFCKQLEIPADSVTNHV